MRPSEIHTLVADDEKLARSRIRELLESDPRFRIVAEARDGLEAVDLIRELKPHLMILDVQMPGIDGFGVLEALKPDELPATVFVSAFDRYAMQAFEEQALDYLLKPFDDTRFWLSMERVIERFSWEDRSELSRSLLDLIRQANPAPIYRRRFLVKSGKRMISVAAAKIESISAAGVYAELHHGKNTTLIRYSLNRLIQQLDPNRFLRIHRSTIVNLDAVVELQPSGHGEYFVLTRSGQKLTLSRSYRDQALQALGR